MARRLFWLALTAMACCRLTAQDVKLEVTIEKHAPVFFAGEPIHLHLAFSTSVPKTYVWEGRMPNRRYEVGLEDVSVSPASGWDDPWAEYREAMNTRIGCVGGGPNSFSLMDAKAQEMLLRLSDFVRFSRPGHYTIQIVSRRVRHARSRSPEWLPEQDDMELISNPVQLTIVASSPEWKQARAQEAMAVLGRNSGDLTDAAEWLQTLDTREAAAAMIAYMGLGSMENTPYSPDFVAGGLLTSSHRKWIIERLKAGISDPSYSVSDSFFATLADLIALDQGVDQEWAQRRDLLVYDLEEQALATLPQKTGAAYATTLSALVDASVSWPEHDDTQLLNMALQQFPQLTPQAQTTLLSARWEAVKGADMIPRLRSYLSGSRPKSNYELTLNRLNEISPEDARKLILADMVRSSPRFSSRALGLLPDKELPELDSVFAENLESSSSNRGIVSALIQRYGSSALFPQAEKAFEEAGAGRSCEANLLAYMLRVQPSVAIEHIREAMKPVDPQIKCYRSLLQAIAQLEPAHELEPLAIEDLNNLDGYEAMSAVNTLQIVGGEAAKQALFHRLEQWHKTWMGRENQMPSMIWGDAYATDAPLGNDISNALMTARNWILTDQEIGRVSSLMVTTSERQQVKAMRDELNRRPVPLSFWSDGTFRIFQIGIFNNYRRIEDLERKVDQYPAGTVFTLPENDNQNAATLAAIAEIKSYIEGHGKRIEAK
jgi:hypothetical protein